MYLQRIKHPDWINKKHVLWNCIIFVNIFETNFCYKMAAGSPKHSIVLYLPTCNWGHVNKILISLKT
jgi:hypothetical protein